MKLDDRDKRILALLGTQRHPVSDLTGGLDTPPEQLRERLVELADNGLVYECGDGQYERTESGRRVLLTSAGVAVDERIDTTPEIEQAIDEFALRADEADAVRHVFALLRYWGSVTEEEIIDAIYSEAPAGRETPHEWWELVRDPLASLPGVELPSDAEEPWRYTGIPEADQPLTDGRRLLSETHAIYGDVKHALESLALTDGERRAARAAFIYLYRRGEVTEQDVCDAVYPLYPAEYSSADAWWDEIVVAAFNALPRVEQTNGGSWRYRWK